MNEHNFSVGIATLLRLMIWALETHPMHLLLFYFGRSLPDHPSMSGYFFVLRMVDFVLLCGGRARMLNISVSPVFVKLRFVV
jgi:hypothetical protein